MVFNQALDIWIWGIVVAFLAMMGIRAWVVENGRGRLGRTSAKVKVLNGSIVTVVAALVVMLTIQGGALLVHSVVTKTDPKPAAQVDPGAAQPAGTPAAPGAQPPAAPPAAG